MESTGKNMELIDKFILNQRKSRMWTIISVGIFCLLGGLVFFLAYELNKSNARYKELSDKFEKLAIENIALNEQCENEAVTLTSQIRNWKMELDSLKKVCDTVTLLFNAQSRFNTDFEIDPGNSLDLLGKQAFKKENLVLSDNLKKLIIDPRRWNTTTKPVYTIQLKCMQKYEEDAYLVWEKLKEENRNGKKYAIQGIQIIQTSPTNQKISFNPLVKYFYDDDVVLAKFIADKLNNSGIDFFKNNPVTIQKQTINAPPGQVEVWIGKYEKTDIRQLILESGKYKRTI